MQTSEVWGFWRCRDNEKNQLEAERSPCERYILVISPETRCLGDGCQLGDHAVFKLDRKTIKGVHKPGIQIRSQMDSKISKPVKFRNCTHHKYWSFEWDTSKVKLGQNRSC